MKNNVLLIILIIMSLGYLLHIFYFPNKIYENVGITCIAISILITSSVRLFFPKTYNDSLIV